METTDLAQAGLDLLEFGLTPIPVNWRDKNPIVSWGQYVEEKPSKSRVRNWFLGTSPKNMAIIVGKESGICVLDIDEPELFPFEMPTTPTVKTSRGFHLYFQYPSNVAIRNTDLPYGDFKADRTLVTVPPSIHKDGTRYEWLIGLDTPFAPIPEWLLDIVKQRIRLDSNHFPTPIEASWHEDQETTAYGARALAEEIERVASAPSGERNNQLNTSAVKVSSLIAGGQINPDEAREALIQATKENGEWFESSIEVNNTLKSAERKGLANPRAPIPKADNDNPKPSTFKLKSMVDVDEAPIDWVWSGVLSKGALSIIAGKPKTGKSQVSLAVAATISRGDYFPCSKEKATKGSVIIVSSEDRAEDTIKPRLMALGADMSKIFVIESEDENGNLRPCNLQTDLVELDRVITEQGDVQLVIFDVVDSYMGKGNANDNTDVRALCARLNILAQKHLLCMLLIRHKRKDDTGDALNTMSGSVAWGGAARANWQITSDPEYRAGRVMSNMGGNNTGSDDAFKFEIKEKIIKGMTTSYVEWKGEKIKMSADEAMADSAMGPRIREAVEWLEDRIEPGVAVDQAVIKKEAAENDIADRTLRRARQIVGLTPERVGIKYMWKRPLSKAA